MKKIHTISFKHAFEGLWYACKSQPNFRIHIVLSSLAIVLGVLLHITQIQWTILTMTITLGLVIETINTSIESVVDLVTQEWRINAKRAKDTAAAAMLIYAIGAIGVAGWLFLPKIFF